MITKFSLLSRIHQSLIKCRCCWLRWQRKLSNSVFTCQTPCMFECSCGFTLLPMDEQPKKGLKFSVLVFDFTISVRPFSHALTFTYISMCRSRNRTVQMNRIVYTFGSHANLIVTSIYCLCRRTTMHARTHTPRRSSHCAVSTCWDTHRTAHNMRSNSSRSHI